MILQKKILSILEKVTKLKKIKAEDIKDFFNLISTKAALFTLLVCFIPSFIIGSYFINQSMEFLMEAAGNNNKKVAELVANDIGSYIINKKNFMMVSVGNQAIKSMTLQTAKPYLEEIKTYYGNDNALSISDKQGQKIYSTHSQLGNKLNLQKLEKLWQYNMIFDTDLHKDNIGNFSINGSIPIYRDNNEMAGILSLDIPLQNINVLIEQVLAQNPSYGIMLINGNGVPLFSQNNTEAVKNKQVLEFDFVAKAVKEKNGTMQSLIRGEEYLVAFRQIENTDFIVVTTYPKAYVTAVANNMAQQGLLFLLGIITITMVLGMILSKKTLAPFGYMVKGVKAVANGDLAYRLKINSKDEFGLLAQGFNKMNENLQELVSSVQTSSVFINKTTNMALTESITARNNSNKVVDFAKVMLNKIENQSEKTLIAKHSLDELNDITKKVVAGMATTLTTTKQCVNISNEGKNSINNTIVAMNNIKEQVSQTVSTVENLDNSVKEINKISDTISMFANQTNLLALNASIEAVRAGEYGRGFAVVAEEIRTLAEQSKTATAQIAKISTNVMAATQQVIVQMQSSGLKVEQGAEIVKTTDIAFNEINAAVLTAQQQSDIIFNQAEEQIQLFDTVRKQVEFINELGYDNRESANEIVQIINKQKNNIAEINTANEHLLNLVKEFEVLLNNFKLN